MEEVGERMGSEVDVVYGGEDKGVGSGMKRVIKVRNEKKIGVIGGVDRMVKDGGLGSICVSEYDIGYEGGMMGGKVVKGKDGGR